MLLTDCKLPRRSIVQFHRRRSSAKLAPNCGVDDWTEEPQWRKFTVRKVQQLKELHKVEPDQNKNECNFEYGLRIQSYVELTTLKNLACLSIHGSSESFSLSSVSSAPAADHR